MSTISFTGLASGIDTDALIKATSDATRKTRVKPSQDKVTELTDTNDALTELKNRLKTLQNVLLNCTTLKGGPLAKLATSSDESTLTATATNGAINASYEIESITSLASATAIELNRGGLGFASSSAHFATGGLGPLEFKVGESGDTISIPFTANLTTVGEIVSAINAATTDASASLVQVASGDYRVIISSTSPGTDNQILTVTGPGPYSEDVEGLGGTGVNSSCTNSATDAVFKLTSMTSSITRSSNTITDAIDGVTLTLRQAPGATSIRVNISDDVTTTQTTIQDFIDAYNKVVGYIQENDQISRDESDPNNVKMIYGSLSKTSVDNNSLTAMRSELFAAVYESGTYIRMLADIGITTDAGAYDKTTGTGGGTLKFDTAVFTTAMNREAVSVNEIFKTLADSAALTGGTIDQFIRFNGMFDTTITANKTTMSSLNDRIAEAEAQILKTEESMKARFARLEATMGKLQSQQTQLTSALAGLGR